MKSQVEMQIEQKIDIKKEIDVDIKEEKESDNEVESEMDLYTDHVIKEEMVIGPELVQRADNSRSDCFEDHNEKVGDNMVRNILKANNINYSPRSSSPDRLSMYSSRGCSPSLTNLSYSKLMHGLELNVDESQYHELINLPKNKQKDTESINLKHKLENMQGPVSHNHIAGNHLTFTYSFEDDLSQNSIDIKLRNEQKQEEKKKEIATEKEEMTGNEEGIEKKQESDRDEEIERDEETNREEEIEREEETNREEETERMEETEREEGTVREKEPGLEEETEREEGTERDEETNREEETERMEETEREEGTVREKEPGLEEETEREEGTERDEETNREEETERMEETEREEGTVREKEPEMEEETEREEGNEREEDPEREEETERAEEFERKDEVEREEVTDEENEQESFDEEEEADFESNDSDEYCPSEVVSELSAITNNDEEDAQDDGEESEWEDITDFTLNLEECTLDESTINFSIENTTPDGIFSLFLTDELIEKMVTETNKYASEYNTEKNDKKQMKRKSRLLAWKPTNATEMRKFLGVLLVMGLNKVPHINDYWSKKSIYRNEYIVSVMTRDRFLLILKFWHFSDSDTNNTSKLKKIEDLITMLNNRFQEVLTPGKYLVIDESMIPWRGRLGFRQYIKNKSHKYGVKLYKLCTPEGYTYNSIVYAGKGENGREKNHGQVTVLKLIRGLENKSREVIADNFYSSIGLAEQLLSRQTLYCGTLNSNRRGLPKKLVSLKLKKGQIKGVMNKNGVKIIKWVDKRPLLMLSTRKEDKDVLVNTGKINRKTKEQVQKPSCVLTYNNNKKGVDYSDQMSSYYSPLKRGLKWFRKVGMEYLFGMALVNAWIIYNMKNDRISKKTFTEAIIESLTGKKICPENDNKKQSVKTNKNTEQVNKDPRTDEIKPKIKKEKRGRKKKQTDKSNIDDSNKPYSCPKCSYKCSLRSNLSKHLLIHTGEKPFRCSFCKFKCNHKSNLNEHLKVHSEEKPYACTFCDYKCNRKNYLNSHLKVHSGEKPFSCSVCNYKSTHKSTLERHLRLHNGEKPYSCTICNFKSARKQALDDHVKVHTGEKPFSCTICDYKCIRQCNLAKHVLVHSRERYSCSSCKYKSLKKDRLSEHMKIHTGDEAPC